MPSTEEKCSFTKEQVIIVANRFTKELGTKEFITRFQQFIQNRGAMDPDKLFDELENLQKFVYAEWDIYPEVSPDDMIESLHVAAKKYDDEETHKALDFLCSRIQWLLNVVGTQHMAATTGQQPPPPQHDQHGSAHGHSHNGQPCHGHGHGAGAGGMPNPIQMQIMQFAVQFALSDDERAFMSETQKIMMDAQQAMMQGKKPEIDPREFDQARRARMGQTQMKLMTWMHQNGTMVKEQMDAAFHTALTEEEREFAAETQKMVMEGKISDPEDERIKKVETFQGKVHAYVQTMLSFLIPSLSGDSGANQQEEQQQSDPSSSTGKQEASKEK